MPRREIAGLGRAFAIAGTLFLCIALPALTQTVNDPAVQV